MKKIALTTILVGTLGFGTVAFACGNKHYAKGCGESFKSNICDSKKGHCDMMGSKLGVNYIVDTISAMNLTADQESKIEAIIKEHQENLTNKSNISAAFEGGKFDKNKFIAVINKRDIMIQSQADMVEKIYKVLTKEQKSQLQKELVAYGTNQDACGSNKMRGCGSPSDNKTKGCPNK